MKEQNEGAIFYAMRDSHYVIKFIGEIRLTLCGALDRHLERVLSSGKCQHVLVDLTESDFLDSTTLGLIAKIAIRAKEQKLADPVLVSVNADVTRTLLNMGFDRIFVILDLLPETVTELKQVPMVQESLEATQQRIINAHKVLMSLNETNYQAFCNLVSTLEEK
ncbi:STAS domain-containing protein [Neptunomonas sp.]|uniref:STAS domain-containing protein n=1 Tax=Neptunomonas TaxID=75687 RepID=UPI0035120BE1